MENIQIQSDLVEQLIELSKEAGKAILEVYNTNFDYQLKEDLSPLTRADTLSNNIICERLKALTPETPILSEENSDIPFNVRSQWNQYWLVDPLDGTKEFINKNGEFTVNIALIERSTPILGIIHIPVSNETYWGSVNNGSFFSKSNSKPIKINVSENPESPVRILISKSHQSNSLKKLLAIIDDYKVINKGSSLKFCLVASGKADVYLRLGPTSEWDTAAGEAIVKYAGGYILTADGKMMSYNQKDNLLNPDFIVSGNKSFISKLLPLIKKI